MRILWLVYSALVGSLTSLVLRNEQNIYKTKTFSSFQGKAIKMDVANTDFPYSAVFSLNSLKW